MRWFQDDEERAGGDESDRLEDDEGALVGLPADSEPHFDFLTHLMNIGLLVCPHRIVSRSSAHEADDRLRGLTVRLDERPPGLRLTDPRLLRDELHVLLRYLNLRGGGRLRARAVPDQRFADDLH